MKPKLPLYQHQTKLYRKEINSLISIMINKNVFSKYSHVQFNAGDTFWGKHC